MFISGRSYGNSLKYKAFYVCMGFMLMALFSTVFIVKPAFATDNSHSINQGTVKCPDNYTPKQDGKDSGWWGCSWSNIFTGEKDPVFTCNAGWKPEVKTETKELVLQGRKIPTTYKLGHCVEEKTSSTNKSVVEKNAEALANKAGQSDLVNLISTKIESSPWFLGLSDADKAAAGCKSQKVETDKGPHGSQDSVLVCDDAAKQKLAKMLIGTCIASAVKTVAKRTNGDTGSGAMDAVFTSCLAGNSGIDEKTIKSQKSEIAWDDIKKDVNTSGSAATEESKADEAKNSCGVDGVGWLICPLMNFASNISDSAYSAISQFLSIDPKIFKNDSTSGGLKQAWNFFRDIANAVFAVIFLWVIFSQISNVGVSNYGIKKILPRLIIGALLVNLSFYLCQLAVDLSNILGFSLKGVLEGAASGIDTQSAAAGSISTFMAGALALTGAALFLFLAVSIPTITALLLALLVVLVILIVRQAAIILLIAVSPLAFAAWLLPNTENLFKKWISMFKGLLVVFPVVSLLYGAGKLAGAVLAASATDDPNNPKETMQFAALAASILPLGATPFVLQSSLNSLGSIGAKIGKMSANAHGRFAGNVKGVAKRRVDNSVIGDTKRKYSDFMDRKRASMRTGKFATWRDNSPIGRFMGWDKGGARARATVAKAFESDVENAATMLQGMTSNEIADIANGKAAASKALRAAAVDHTMANGSFQNRMDVLSSLKGVDTSIKQRAIKAAYAKKDNNIIGNKFGDAILEDKIDNITDLENMAINNAVDGNLQAEHLVQNGAATKWLSEAITNSKNQQAEDAFIQAGEIAISNPNTAKNMNQTILDALSAHGVVAHNTPQNTSSSNSQQNSQGSGSQQSSHNGQQGNSSSQQSSQNNQQSNSSSGGIIIATSQGDVRKALEDSRRRGN